MIILVSIALVAFAGAPVVGLAIESEFVLGREPYILMFG
jgi:hypothetical protein